MNIGIPKEIMTGESRVALTPAACAPLVEAGHTVFVQGGAGLASGYADAEFAAAGCQLLDTLEQVYVEAQLIVKVKQPLAADLACLRAHHIVFSYFHLAADHALIERLCDIGLTAIPFESVRDEAGALPLLAPMSAIAGRIAVMRGATLLFRNRGGRGVLLGGIDNTGAGIEAGNVVVLGAGVAGRHAVATASNLCADVTVFDLDEAKLADLQQRYPPIHTVLSNADAVAQACLEADLVIGAVLVAGRRAPVVVPDTVVRNMREGSVIVDIAIDQGGCVEGIEATDSDTLYKVKHGVLQSAVPNMPAATPRTATQALANVVAPCVRCIADGEMNDALRRAIVISDGRIIDPVLQQEVAA